MKRFILPIILFFFAIGAGIYCSFALFRDYNLAAGIACTVLIFVFCVLSSVFHELGHMLFGAMVKIRAIPSVRIMRASSSKIIPKTDTGLRGRLVFTALGGLFVNALFTVAGLLALLIPGVPTALCVALPSSGYLFVLNALPLRFDSGNTDGQTVLSLIRKDSVAQVTLAVLTVQAKVLKGTPIEEIDESLLFDLPQIAEDEESFISLTELRYEYCKAKGDDEAAARYKQRFEELQEYL